MNFNSLQYLLFLPAVVILYYILRPALRNYMLLAASYFFYMCWNPTYALLMLTSTAVTFLSALFIERRWLGRQKLWLVLSLLLNLAILFFFKYFNFVAGLLGDLLALVGWRLQSPALQILLPMGISFYIFQALGYTIDVYRGHTRAEHNFALYALFVSFFPQLVAGPIERSGNLLPQFRELHRFNWRNIQEGFLPLLWGMFKKVVLADQLAVLANTAYNDPFAHNGSQLALATLAFALQIYCDFSAYSDIARGSAQMLGFRLMLNFKQPYFAVSVKDFWHRWHISLSTWFKDYLYIPLGGSRVTRWRNYLNVLIVFVISGLWHGAALTYVFWGFLNGAYQVIGSLLQPAKDKLFRALHLPTRSLLWTALRRLVTFVLICSTWVFFRAASIAEAVYIGQTMLEGLGQPLDLLSWLQLGLNQPQLIQLALGVLLLLIVDRLQLRDKNLEQRINGYFLRRYALYFLLLVIILLFGSYGPGFDPQDFIYFQF